MRKNFCRGEIFEKTEISYFREVWFSDFDQLSSIISDFEDFAFESEFKMSVSGHNGVLVGSRSCYLARRHVSGHDDVSLCTNAWQWAQRRVTGQQTVTVRTRACSRHEAVTVGLKAYIVWLEKQMCQARRRRKKFQFFKSMGVFN